MIKNIILSIIALSALLVGQKAYWVDVTNGNDSNDGSSENQAFKTIQYFTSSINWADGDTLYVKPSEDGSGSLTYYDFGNKEANINSNNDLVSLVPAEEIEPYLMRRVKIDILQKMEMVI